MSAKPSAPASADRVSGTIVVLINLADMLAALEAAEAATPRLAADEVARHLNASSSRGTVDAALWRAAHIALRLLLERYAGPGVRGQAYAIEPGGRPRLYLPGAQRTAPHFSLSHAGAYALIALSDVAPVGIDLETERTVTVADARRQRIETAAARLATDAHLPDSGNARFLQAWVRLEAVAKASGLGIGRILTEAGAVGGSGAADTVPIHAGLVRDLVLPEGCYGAISGLQLPPILLVQQVTSKAGGLSGLRGLAG
ncbi:MAG: phosphopantetheinyl transferase [Hyphomicrobium sp.]